MGAHQNIAHDRFPEQAPWLGRRVRVVFHYDTANPVMGEVVRDDADEPLRTVIRLDDGRYVLSTECQYGPLPVASLADAGASQ